MSSALVSSWIRFSVKAPRSQTRAWIGSVALHLAVFAGGAASLLFATAPRRIEVTPVMLVANAPHAQAPAAEKAPATQTAAAPIPSPETTPPPPAAPAPPIPKSIPALSKPLQAPLPKPPAPTPPPKPTPLAKATPKPTPRPQLNLDQLASAAPRTLDLAGLASGTGRSAHAPHAGPARAETAEIARHAIGPGVALSADARAYLAAKLIKLWNPNCGVEDAANVVVRVAISLSPEGRVLRARDVTGPESAIVEAAAERAMAAVHEGDPYDGLPRESYAAWREVTFNFIAKDACRR